MEFVFADMYDMTVIMYTTTNKGCCVVDCVLDY